MKKILEPFEPISFNPVGNGGIAPWNSAPNLSAAMTRNGKNQKREEKGKEKKRKLSTRVKERALSLFTRRSSGVSNNEQKCTKEIAESENSAAKAEFMKKVNGSNSFKSSLPSLLSGLPPEAFGPQTITILPAQHRKEDKNLLKALNKMISEFDIKPKPLKPSKSFHVTSATDPRLVEDEMEASVMVPVQRTVFFEKASSKMIDGKLELEKFLLQDMTPRSKKWFHSNKRDGNNSIEKKKHHRSLPSIFPFKKLNFKKIFSSSVPLNKKSVSFNERLNEKYIYENQAEEPAGSKYPIDVIDVVSGTSLGNGLRSIAVQTPPWIEQLDLFNEHIEAMRDEFELWRGENRENKKKLLEAFVNQSESERRDAESLRSLEREIEEEMERLFIVKSRVALNNLRIKDQLFKQ